MEKGAMYNRQSILQRKIIKVVDKNASFRVSPSSSSLLLSKDQDHKKEESNENQKLNKLGVGMTKSTI